MLAEKFGGGRRFQGLRQCSKLTGHNQWFGAPKMSGCGNFSEFQEHFGRDYMAVSQPIGLIFFMVTPTEVLGGFNFIASLGAIRILR